MERTLNNPPLVGTVITVSRLKSVKGIYKAYISYYKTFGRGIQLPPLKDLIRLFILSENSNILPVKDYTLDFNKVTINKLEYKRSDITKSFKQFLVQYIDIQTDLLEIKQSKTA